MTLTESLAYDWRAKTTSGVLLPEYFGAAVGQRDREFVGKERTRGVPWVRIVFPVSEEVTSCRITTIAFPRKTEELVPRTILGRKLLSLRSQAIQAGMRLLSADEVLEESRRRRGEFDDDEKDLS